jgi:uncharacterized membrane protein
MEQKKSKYDTNPLDPDFVKQTEEIRNAGDRNSDTQEVSGATREFSEPVNEQANQSAYSEAPTRRYDNVPTDTPYPSMFVPPSYSAPAPYQPASAPYRPVEQKPTARPVSGIGLPEKWAMILPYAPFFIGVVPALLELFLVPRRELRVRFHAAQGLALHIAILVVQTLFGAVSAVTGSSAGGSLFWLASTIFLFVSMARVWKGRPHHIAPITEPSRWLNEHIEPRNKS